MRGKDDDAALKNIHLKLLILACITTPCVTATGAYWGLKIQIEEKDRQISDRISRVELSDQKTFADKESLKTLNTKVDQISQDVTEIKTILRHNSRAR